jgi:hypothetical protein
MTCEDFAELDQSFQPTAIRGIGAYGEQRPGRGRSGGREGGESAVPIIVQEHQ